MGKTKTNVKPKCCKCCALSIQIQKKYTSNGLSLTDWDSTCGKERRKQQYS